VVLQAREQRCCPCPRLCVWRESGRARESGEHRARETCVFVHEHVYLNVYVYVYVYVCVCVYVFVYEYVYVFLYVCVYVYVYVYEYAYVYVSSARVSRGRVALKARQQRCCPCRGLCGESERVREKGRAVYVYVSMYMCMCVYVYVYNVCAHRYPGHTWVGRRGSSEIPSVGA